MTESKKPNSQGAVETLMKPIAEVETSIGRVYLYPILLGDLLDFGKLEPACAVVQIRNFLPNIGSLAVVSAGIAERIPLDREIAKTLSNDEVDRLAEAYVQSPEWQRVDEVDGDCKPVGRGEGEAASAYLVRLLMNKYDRLGQMFGSGRGLFDQVRKSAFALGSVLNEYKQFTKLQVPLIPDIESIPEVDFDAQERHGMERARTREKQRAEELALARLTGEMTEKSARTLKDLAEAATTLMERMDERDKKSDQSTRKQITIAVWSVGISAVLALFALIVSGLAYRQDRDNIEAGEKWQTELIDAVRDGNRQRDAAGTEAQRLRSRVAELETKLACIKLAPTGTAAVSKCLDFSGSCIIATDGALLSP